LYHGISRRPRAVALSRCSMGPRPHRSFATEAAGPQAAQIG
jgi:hypothetical protein